MLGWVDTETGTVILSADRDGFRDFISSLRSLMPVTISLGRAENWPMARPIRGLSIELDGEAVVIAVNRHTATFKGNVAGLERMARELEAFAEDDELDEPGSHAHLGPGDDANSKAVVRSLGILSFPETLRQLGETQI
jgi:hypothetical protein